MRENGLSTARRTDRTTVPNNSAPTTKQLREEQRAAKVAALKEKQKREKRNIIIGVTLGAIALLAAIALLLWFIFSQAVPKQDPADIEISGLETWDDLTGGQHADVVDGQVVENPAKIDYATEYDMNPPAGGAHYGAWLNCGVYTEPQESERAVHSLEHGAVWVTYNADELSEDEIKTLQDSVPNSYIVLSPYEGLDAPVVASAWGAQVKLDGVDDERLEQFIDKFWKSASAPEPGARCDGAVDGPGKIA